MERELERVALLTDGALDGVPPGVGPLTERRGRNAHPHARRGAFAVRGPWVRGIYFQLSVFVGVVLYGVVVDIGVVPGPSFALAGDAISGSCALVGAGLVAVELASLRRRGDGLFVAGTATLGLASVATISSMASAAGGLHAHVHLAVLTVEIVAAMLLIGAAFPGEARTRVPTIATAQSLWRGRHGPQEPGFAALLVALPVLAAAIVVALLGPGPAGVEWAPARWLRWMACLLLLISAIARALRLRALSLRAAARLERTRVARDIHDGLAQDLALIAAHAPVMAGDLGESHPVVAAARRALAASRETITSLADDPQAPLEEALEMIALELRERFGVGVAVQVLGHPTPSGAVRAQLFRIMRETVANAIRHGEARHVVITLETRSGGLVLRVIDDGSGFAAREAVEHGFGLRRLSEEVEGFGGDLTIRPGRGGGVTVEAVFP